MITHLILETDAKRLVMYNGYHKLPAKNVKRLFNK